MWSTLTGKSNMYREFKVWSIGKYPQKIEKILLLEVLGFRVKALSPCF